MAENIQNPLDEQVDSEGFVTHTFICIKCAQTRVVRHRPNLDIGSAQWHDCDPENLLHPARQISADMWRLLSFMSGNPLKIGDKDIFDSAYDDTERRSTKKI